MIAAAPFSSMEKPGDSLQQTIPSMSIFYHGTSAGLFGRFSLDHALAGVDRGALQATMNLGLDWGGRAPKG